MAVTVDTTINVKQTIQIIIQKVTGSNGAGRLNHFAIRANENGVEVLLYVKSVRLNFEDASVLIDAAVFVWKSRQHLHTRPVGPGPHFKRTNACHRGTLIRADSMENNFLCYEREDQE
jgi:hypothetical protein